MTQEEKMQELQNNPQQQKMLNEIFAATNEAIKKEFPVYAKLVQADVSNFIMQSANKDGQLSAQIVELSDVINQIANQVGKDMDKRMKAEFEKLKKETSE